MNKALDPMPDGGVAMFKVKDLFTGKRETRELTSLNLNAAASSSTSALSAPALSAPSASSGCSVPAAGAVEARERAAQVFKAPFSQQVIEERAKMLFASGRGPETFFALNHQQTGGLITLPSPNPPYLTLLLFSSSFVARDYVEATGIDAEPLPVQVEALAELGPRWRTAGIDSFAVDRCPRCNIIARQCPEDGLIAKSPLLLVWAMQSAIKDARGRLLVQQFLAYPAKDHAPRRVALEFFRDHVDCGVPQVHWLIAILAGMQHDEQQRLASEARLREFGPQFAGRVTKMTEASQREVWLKSLSDATFGLLDRYGLFDDLKQAGSA